MDFTFKTFQEFLCAFVKKGYGFLSYAESIEKGEKWERQKTGNRKVVKLEMGELEKFCVLRHDVDKIPENALRMAELEAEMGIYGTYFFRIVPASFNINIIEKIAKLGHEIGYHYEEVRFYNYKIARLQDYKI